jgi:pyruvate dehydrogenase E2 component (dihydrolipoamide acetyltransferase)
VIAGPDGADAVAIRTMVYLSLVFDHRAMDGEAASRFLRMVKEALEAWA